MRAAGTVYVQVGTDDDGHLLIDNGGRDQNAAETLLNVESDSSELSGKHTVRVREVELHASELKAPKVITETSSR